MLNPDVLHSVLVPDHAGEALSLGLDSSTRKYHAHNCREACSKLFPGGHDSDSLILATNRLKYLAICYLSFPVDSWVQARR